MIAETILNKVRAKGDTLAGIIRRVYAGLENRATIRRQQPTNGGSPETERVLDLHVPATPALGDRSPFPLTRLQRSNRLAQLQARSKSEDDAIAAALGLELWGLGIQLLFAVEEDPGSHKH
jgi:hypothetical protein